MNFKLWLERQAANPAEGGKWLKSLDKSAMTMGKLLNSLSPKTTKEAVHAGLESMGPFSDEFHHYFFRSEKFINFVKKHTGRDEIPDPYDLNSNCGGFGCVWFIDDVAIKITIDPVEGHAATILAGSKGTPIIEAQPLKATHYMIASKKVHTDHYMQEIHAAATAVRQGIGLAYAAPDVLRQSGFQGMDQALGNFNIALIKKLLDNAGMKFPTGNPMVGPLVELMNEIYKSGQIDLSGDLYSRNIGFEWEPVENKFGSVANFFKWIAKTIQGPTKPTMIDVGPIGMGRQRFTDRLRRLQGRPGETPTA